ncbi:MAG: LamG-like jellyroll fold domain-containing protein [Armatimonadota bacterium]
MLRWWLFFIVLCSLCAVTPVLADELSNPFSDALGSEQYDCLLTLTPAANISYAATARLTLEAGEGKSRLAVTIKRGLITIEPIDLGRANPAKIYVKATPGKPYHLTFMRRGTGLGVLRGDELVYSGTMPRGKGTLASITADKGWAIDETRVQSLEPVNFSDNFMRTADENGGWAICSGKWALQSAWDSDPKGSANRFSYNMYAENPFAWRGQAADGKPAVCATGKPFWEDYTLSVSVCPAPDGAVGVLVNDAGPTESSAGQLERKSSNPSRPIPYEPQDYTLVRWSPGNDGNRLSLYQVTGGKRKLLAESPGGYVPNQWYRLTVTSNLSGVVVLVDGHVRLTAKRVAPWRGGVGLYAEGPVGSAFDDVSVYGSALHTDLLRERQQIEINQRFLTDPNNMKEWVNLRGGWVQIPNAPNHFANVDRFYGEYWLSLTVKPIIPPNNVNPGELWLGIDGDGQDLFSGYRAVLKLEAGNKVSYTLFRGKETLATTTADMLSTTEEYTLRLRRQGKRVWLEQDGEMVLEAVDPNPISGRHPSYYVDGCFTQIKDLLATGRNVLDYTFSDAPSDWIGDGAWTMTTRWACAPQWSFLGGWSHGDAVLWHKQRFSGDQAFQTFSGVKMEYPRERQIYDHRTRDIAISICTDGRDPRSGYTGIYGAPDEKGALNRRTVLMRNGVVVATAAKVVPGRGESHREWYDLALRKYGHTIEFWVEGQKLLTFQDPDPIDGGVPAIWTRDNGIALARARIHFSSPPKLAGLPRVTLDEPWYPEWLNLGQPLALEFTNAWSSTGKKTALNIVPREVPKGEESSLTTAGNRITFTPRATGSYWYQVAATDGQYESPAFHLLLPVYDPSLKRDDSRALVLYRFDEGAGEIIKDSSPVAPALNVPIPKGAPVTWLPGQGLTLQGSVSLVADGPASKLMAIAKSGVCTMEAWVSTDTLYPPSSWSGCLFSWEPVLNQQNLLMMHRSQTLVMLSKGDNGGQRQAAFGGYRTGLQHYVLAWDGKTVVCYINGKQVSTVPMAMETTKWTPDARLLLGMASNNQFSFFGSYYLLAIHDTFLTAEQVQRHYQAGPSAR